MKAGSITISRRIAKRYGFKVKYHSKPKTYTLDIPDFGIIKNITSEAVWEIVQAKQTRELRIKAGLEK